MLQSIRPTRATTWLAASVDPTEARSVAGPGPDDWAVHRGGNRSRSVPSRPALPASHSGRPTARSRRTRAPPNPYRDRATGGRTPAFTGDDAADPIVGRAERTGRAGGAMGIVARSAIRPGFSLGSLAHRSTARGRSTAWVGCPTRILAPLPVLMRADPSHPGHAVISCGAAPRRRGSRQTGS
jgi:hypothetical protein